MSVPRLRFPGFLGKWEAGKLTKFADIIDGDRGGNYPKSEDFSKTGFCLFLNAKNVTRRGFEFDQTMFIDAERDKLLNNGKAQKADIILTTRGSVGNFAIIDESVPFENIRINSGMVIVRSDLAKLDPKFLYIQCSAPALVRHIQAVAFGSAQPQLTVGEIKKFPVTHPSLPEQRKIAAFLGVVDAKIAALRARVAGLETYKHGLMQALFSQRLRFTKPDGTVFPDWEEKRLGEVAEIIGEGTPDTDTSEYWNGEVNWFTPSEIKTKYLTKSARRISAKGLASSSAKLLPIGALILSTRATVGDVGIATEECATNQGFQSLVMKGKNINEFWYYWLNNNKKAILRKSAGSTFLEIGKSEASKLPVRVPHPDEQQKIANALFAMDAKITAVSAQVAQTQAFKKGLLQQMFV